MSEERTQLEDLSVELFRLIFDCLAPHELLRAFNNLNNRFTAILAQQPLWLPKNHHMNCELYLDYISMISAYASQFVYLHLTERYAPHAVDELLSEVCGDDDSFTLPALKAATVEDLSPDAFISLIEESSLLSNVQSLVFNMSDDCYHYPDYVHSSDIDYILPLLNNLPNLCSLSLRISSGFHDSFIAKMKSFVPLINVHPK
jgi:hypothetical protein